MQCVKSENSVVLCGLGVPVKALCDIASSLYGAAASLAEQTSNALILIANVDGERLKEAFDKPMAGCFEVIENDSIPHALFIKELSNGAFVFSFSSRTAYCFPVADHITNRLVASFDLSDERRECIEMALHEALVNGVIHGNLELGHIKKDTLDSLEAFNEEAEKRLSNQTYAARRIEVYIQSSATSIEVKVVDQGGGFSIDHDKWENMPWRGINLILGLATSVHAGEVDQPLTMKFDR